MENVAHVVVIVKIQPKLFVQHAQLLPLAVHTRSPYKSLMAFGADYQKMIA
jgi:hypothetical protein